MKKYILYELKKNSYAILSLTLIAIVVYMVPILATRQYPTVYSDDTQLAVISVVGGLLAAIVPVWLLSYRMKKRSVDLYYSLPLSRTKILIVKVLVGLVAVFAPYTVAYWLGAAAFIARFSSFTIHPVYYIPQYFLSIPAIVCIYALAAFAFTRANTMLDGIVFILFWFVILALFCSVLDQLTRSIYSDTIKQYVEPQYYFPAAPLNYLTQHYSIRITDDFAYPLDKVNAIVGFILTGLMSIGAGVGLILTERFSKAENAGQISESWFGYKVMIPAYCSLVLCVCRIFISEMYILGIITVICAFFLTVLYKRTVKIGTKWAVILIASVIAGIILSAFSSM